MKKLQIPVYDICNLVNEQGVDDSFIIERFEDYLDKHLNNLYFPHKHAFYHIVLFTAGRGSHTIDFLKFEVKSGDIYFMAPGQVHSWHFEGSVKGYIVNFSEPFFKSFLLNPSYLNQFRFLNGVAQDGVISLPQIQLEKVALLMQNLLELKKQHSPLNNDWVRVKLLDLLITVDSATSSNTLKNIAPSNLLLLNQFRNLIEMHYTTMHLPKEYADLLYVTSNYLNAICKNAVGKTAGEIIRERIVLEAKRLLINAGMTVTEIAYALNFKDNSYFNRFFKKYTQHTPDDFRKQFINT